MSGVNIRYRKKAGLPWEDAEIRSDDPFEVCNRVAERLGHTIAADDPKFDEIMAARKAPQAPCTVRSGPEVSGASLPASTPASQPGKSTESEHRLPAQPAAPGVRDTSMAAYFAMRWTGKLTRQQQVLAHFLAANGQRDYTRQELANATGLAINAICGRVKELLDLGAVEERGRRPCRITGESANALQLRRMEKAA